MKKTVVFLVLAVFCTLASCAALGAQTPENLIACDMPETGYLPGAAMTVDGILFTGVPVGKEVPWVALFDESGVRMWSFSEAGKNVAQYLCPVRMEDGTYTVLRQSRRDDGAYDCARLNLDENGNLLSETRLWTNTQWMIPRAEETYAIGCFSDNGVDYPLVALQDGMGKDLFAYYYAVEGCDSAVFEKGILTDDTLIISGRGVDARYHQSAGLLYRIDLEGNVVWRMTVAAEDPNEYVFANNVYTTGNGRIIWITTTIMEDEDDEVFPAERTSTVYCLNIDGGIIWTYETAADDMLDYVAEVSGGLLFGSQGVNLLYCPFLGYGWLLLLNADGQENPDVDLPMLNDGSVELLGMIANTDNTVLCYGLLLEGPGFPDNPFYAELAIPLTDK
jgi:hypothetical protein